MGNCFETSSHYSTHHHPHHGRLLASSSSSNHHLHQQLHKILPDIGRQEEKASSVVGGGMRVKILLTKAELQWLMLQLHNCKGGVNRMAGGAQALKRIPLIKFPQRRHPKPSGSKPQPQAASTSNDPNQIFFKGSAAPTEVSLGGKASLQPKRTPMTSEEIEAVLLGGCF